MDSLPSSENIDRSIHFLQGCSLPVHKEIQLGIGQVFQRVEEWRLLFGSIECMLQVFLLLEDCNDVLGSQICPNAEGPVFY